MATSRYQVDIARDDGGKNLGEVLDNIATRAGHVRVISVTWQPGEPVRQGGMTSARFTIVSEREA